jgi:hypothetical protein
MRKICANCWYWNYEQMDDANERYGHCQAAINGADETYPWSTMLLKLYGDKSDRERVYAHLLTHEHHRCVLWTMVTERDKAERGIT